MIPKSARLLKTKDIKQVLDKGTKVVTPTLVLYGLALSGARGEHQDPRRLGIIASKKVGNAVERNFAKRRLRSLFAEALSVHPTQGLWNFVVIARRFAVETDFQRLQKDFLYSVKRLQNNVSRTASL